MAFGTLYTHKVRGSASAFCHLLTARAHKAQSPFHRHLRRSQSQRTPSWYRIRRQGQQGGTWDAAQDKPSWSSTYLCRLRWLCAYRMHPHRPLQYVYTVTASVFIPCSANSASQKSRLRVTPPRFSDRPGESIWTSSNGCLSSTRTFCLRSAAASSHWSAAVPSSGPTAMTAWEPCTGIASSRTTTSRRIGTSLASEWLLPTSSWLACLLEASWCSTRCSTPTTRSWLDGSMTSITCPCTEKLPVIFAFWICPFRLYQQKRMIWPRRRSRSKRGRQPLPLRMGMIRPKRRGRSKCDRKPLRLREADLRTVVWRMHPFSHIHQHSTS